MNWRDFFVGKKITLMGLGLLGRGVGDAQFLAEQGAELIVTDLKTEAELADSLEKLRPFSNITYRLGGHNLADFKDRDFILKAAGVPLHTIYVDEARKNGIPIKMSASWFAELSGSTTIGVTGTRGKTTTTYMLYDILRAANKPVLLGGNIRGVSTLSLLSKVQHDPIALMELDSWQCQGWGEDKMSPHIAVFTTFMSDHMNYYKNDMNAYLFDKAQIFLYQKPEDTFVVSEQVLPQLQAYAHASRSRVAVARSGRLELSVPGEHNQLNAACALEAARAFGIDDVTSLKALKEFKGVDGRLQLLREVRGVRIYNDNNSTTPDATIVGLRAVGTTDRRSVVLIVGGDEKNLDMSDLIREIPHWCKAVVLFKERGTDRIRDQVFALQGEGLAVHETEGLEATVMTAMGLATAGDTVLYSPAFSSFGAYFKNEYDRGDQFKALIDAL